jgi:acetylglutamate kinase
MPPVTALPEVRQRTLAKARILLEALPYLKEHFGATIVVKVGGAAMEDPNLAPTFAQDIALLRLVGARPLVVHGGGPQITAMSKRLGIESAFVDGQRVTDEATLEVARMVLLGVVNQDLVAELVREGTPAVGLSGGDDRLLVVRPHAGELGLVGEVERVNVELLEHLMARCVPVIASIGTDEKGQPFNVNADLVAGAVAAAMRAQKLVYLSDVPGLMGSDGSLVSEASVTECEAMIAEGVAEGGMIPKLASAIEAMRSGVGKAHLIDGRVPHAVILELFTPEGLGTMLTHDVPEPGSADDGSGEAVLP